MGCPQAPPFGTTIGTMGTAITSRPPSCVWLAQSPLPHSHPHHHSTSHLVFHPAEETRTEWSLLTAALPAAWCQGAVWLKVGFGGGGTLRGQGCQDHGATPKTQLTITIPNPHGGDTVTPPVGSPGLAPQGSRSGRPRPGAEGTKNTTENPCWRESRAAAFSAAAE